MADHKPLYRWSLQDAIAHNEVQDWRDSYKENCDCARAIERAIADHYHDNVLEDGTKDVLDRYGFDRVNWVLANKWGSYGFEKDGRLRFEEYYPNALEDTYKGIKGYIYSCNKIEPYQKLDIKIPNAFISAKKTTIDNCEFIPDAYNEIIKAEANGLITILRYDDFISNIKRKEWLEKVIIDEYQSNKSHPDYRFFLESRFSAIINHDGAF